MYKPKIGDKLFYNSLPAYGYGVVTKADGATFYIKWSGDGTNSNCIDYVASYGPNSVDGVQISLVAKKPTILILA